MKWRVRTDIKTGSCIPCSLWTVWILSNSVHVFHKPGFYWRRKHKHKIFMSSENKLWRKYKHKKKEIFLSLRWCLHQALFHCDIISLLNDVFSIKCSAHNQCDLTGQVFACKAFLEASPQLTEVLVEWANQAIVVECVWTAVCAISVVIVPCILITCLFDKSVILWGEIGLQPFWELES